MHNSADGITETYIFIIWGCLPVVCWLESLHSLSTGIKLLASFSDDELIVLNEFAVLSVGC